VLATLFCNASAKDENTFEVESGRAVWAISQSAGNVSLSCLSLHPLFNSDCPPNVGRRRGRKRVPNMRVRSVRRTCAGGTPGSELFLQRHGTVLWPLYGVASTLSTNRLNKLFFPALIVQPRKGRSTQKNISEKSGLLDGREGERVTYTCGPVMSYLAEKSRRRLILFHDSDLCLASNGPPHNVAYLRWDSR